VLVFDGTCPLCVAWVDRLRRRQGDDLECLPYQEAQLSARFPNLAPEHLARGVHLIEGDGSVRRGAQAVWRIPGGGRMQTTLLWLCERSPLFARIAETAYRLIAANRRRLSAGFPRRRR
jgi:predicted DCC family thiol-disulfide oxidoreductase YuxK